MHHDNSMHDENGIDRRTAFQQLASALAVAGMAGSASSALADEAAGHRVLAAGKLPNDSRLGALKDLDGYFPFTPPETAEAWEKRAEYVRRQILVACGLWPMPPRPELKPVIYGLVDRPDFTVEKVEVETSPGLFLTGSLFRPKGKTGPRPAILCPHGHWPNGRFFDHGEEKIKSEIASGAEKFEVSGRYPLQARCIQLARMGCVVFHYDMLGYADNVPFDAIAHRFNKQRPEMSKPDHFGLFSPQAELRCINAFGLQTWNSIRALDLVLGLKDVDPKKIGVTGASGGGTQTFILMAVDNRPAAAFPAVMVSTAMQGGCTCENASYLRVETGNIEIAAMAAPRPLGMTGANDWTREIETKGLPELKEHYKKLGVPDNVTAKYYDFPHNYNAVSRKMMYEFFNKHLQLGATSPIEEQDFKPLTMQELTVWSKENPKPPVSEDAEAIVTREWDRISNQQMKELSPTTAEKLAEFKKVVGGALDIMIGRGLPRLGEVEVTPVAEKKLAGYREIGSLLHYKKSEEVPAVVLLPEKPKGEVVLWVSENGKQGLFQPDGTPTAAVKALVDAGVVVGSIDLLYQGEFLSDGQPLKEARRVNNPREFAGFTLGYNHPLFSQRVHDILTAVAIAKEKHPDMKVHLVGLGEAGPLVAAACAQAGDAVGKVAIGTNGFRFASVTEIRSPQLLPGAVKYGDVPAFVALCAPHPLFLAGEGKTAPEIVAGAYKSSGATVESFAGPAGEEAMAAAKWLLS